VPQPDVSDIPQVRHAIFVRSAANIVKNDIYLIFYYVTKLFVFYTIMLYILYGAVLSKHPHMETRKCRRHLFFVRFRRSTFMSV
jgi:hypothetical protein